MNERRSFLSAIPAGVWVGVAALGLMALIPPLRPFVVFAAVVVLGYTVFHMWLRQGELMDRLDAARAPEVAIKVQPEGPSFQEVLRAIPDPVMIVSGYEPDDIAGRWIVFANDAAQKVFHMTGEGGMLVSTIRTPEVLECVDEALFGRIARSATFETTGGARDQFWRASTAPLPVDTDSHRLALLVIRDETDMRRMERMRADFLANASHELRTPLASLTGFIETLRGPARDDDKARDKFLGIMATQADRMGRLIHDLLSLSRIEMNEHVPPSGEADLVLAVRHVVEGLTLIAQQNDVRLTVAAPKPGLFPIIGDRDQILQVVQNLVDNALKYAPRGSDVTIDVAFDKSLTEAMAATDPQAAKLVLLRPDRNVHEHYALVRVRDNGPGIRREFLPRLAERFYRVEGQKSGDRLGTGLGLAIVKHIINRHRGGLVVESLGQAGAAEDLVMIEPESDTTRVTALPVVGLATFTAFTAYFPQQRAYGVAGAPKLVQAPEASAPLKPEPLKPAPLKDVG